MVAPILHLSIPVADLGPALDFYEHELGCRVGRVHADWCDVWFFGLQLTLHESPDEVAALADPGTRHFGVTLPDADAFGALVARLEAYGARWISAPQQHDATELSGKTGGKLADPSGNVVEVKYYADLPDYLAEGSSPET